LVIFGFSLSKIGNRNNAAIKKRKNVNEGITFKPILAKTAIPPPQIAAPMIARSALVFEGIGGKIQHMADYQPNKKILQKYAEVLVNFALNSGKGVKKGEVVLCQVPDVAKPLALELQNAILKAGAQPIMRLLPTQFSKDFYTLASDAQIKFFPEKYLQAQADLIDHRIAVIAEVDPFELKNIDPKKPLLSLTSIKPYRDWLQAKEVAGKHTWTIALWATPAKAQLVGLSLESYWQQIIKACFLDKASPIKEWQKVFSLQEKILKKINTLNIQRVQVKGKEVDLSLKIGHDRLWQGGTGRNIPSFEIFTSPDWRGTEGWIKFNQPLYRYGNIVSGISLNFKAGKIITPIVCENIDICKDWSDSRDFIEAIWLMLNHSVPLTYILSSGKLNSLINFINIVCKYLNINTVWKEDNNKLLLYHNNNIILIGKHSKDNIFIIGNNNETKKLLNWNPHITFEKMIFDMIFNDS